VGPAALTIRDLAKRYVSVEALKGVDLAVDEGELAALHGVLSQVGKIETPSGPFGTYSGQIQFGSP
jgi:ABC-type branched-subunit amino acid transport system ATPase component